jgi:nitroimidazol reductase NimA-like FMN-containing flavoprotein (pyridoxamine 5'-phosphate oxidase superfamily)
MPGRASTIVFGKISLASEIESMDSLVKHLGNILEKYGYPVDSGPVKQKESEQVQKEISEARKKLDEMMSPNGGEDTQS